MNPADRRRGCRAGKGSGKEGAPLPGAVPEPTHPPVTLHPEPTHPPQ